MVIRVPEAKERLREKTMFDRIMAENFLKLTKNIKEQCSFGTLSRLNNNKCTFWDRIVKLWKFT